MAKQSAQDRARRLSEGCCPVHGIPLSQVGITEDGRRSIAGCPRKDCDIRGVPDGPRAFALFPQFEHLLKGE